MHISLDSALGQQRRLSQVGESITQIAPDPAAAYSLRSLTGGDPKVVRVRRESDNHEQDFTASDVSSGALVNFVNSQVTAPLDIQALTATGRDGDFLIATAAYSLRSLGTRQATVAATGDTVARADGKYVCQVRRDSDDALKSFTADEITDGTLVDFVGLIPNGVFANTGYESFTNASESGFTASNTGSTGFAVSDIADGGSGDVINVSFDISITNGSPSISLRSSLAGGAVASNSSTYTSSGSYTATLTATGSYVGVGFTEGDAPSNFTVSNFKVLGNGFVKTWYDQSVTTQAGDTATGNHATQATAASQPKIVSAGSLLTAGVTFDGSDDHLEFTEISNTGAFSLFIASNISNDGGMVLGDSSGSGNFVRYASTNAVCKIAGSEYNFGDSRDTSLDIINFNRDGSNSLSATRNSSAIGSSQTATGTFDIDLIGVRNNDVNPITGAIKELIIYSTDQTDNRTAIEANIGEHYSISGIPAFDNSVNGFVETWYDQSGNGNNLTQATASKQPTIVTSGAINTRNSQPIIKFIQANSTFLEIADSSMFPTGSNIAVTIFHAMHIDVSSSDRMGVFGNNNGGSNAQTNTYRFGSGTSRRVIVKFADASNTQVELISGFYTNDSDSILTYQFAVNGGTASLQAFNNGSSLSSNSASTTDQSYGPVSDSIILGARRTLDNFSDSEFFEVIAYDSDQLSNRSAIETNMNSHYSIF